MTKVVIDVQPMQKLFHEVLGPKDLVEYLIEIEEQYTSYVIKDESAPRLKSDNQIYYLRELRKAISNVPIAIQQSA